LPTSTGRIFFSKNASCSGVGVSLNGAAAAGGDGAPLANAGSALNSSRERDPSLLASSRSKSRLPSAGFAWTFAFLPTSLRNSSGLSYPT
jgi:hypothetical protein